MKLTPYLIALLRETRAQILAAPPRYDQTATERLTCSSPACLVGWIAALHHRRHHTRCGDPYTAVMTILQRELKVDLGEAHRLVGVLYYASRWPNHLYARYLLNDGGTRDNARLAAVCLTHFIRHLE